MKLLRLFSLAAIAAGLFFAGVAAAQQPIKVGIGIAQTGSLGAGGKAALLAIQMWVEDVNAKGGLLGRKVELIAYDDQTNPALTPGIYTKLLDVDKVDLIIAPYGTVPTAPIMPLVKQRNPRAREQAADTVELLVRLGDSMRATMLRRALREYTTGS